MKPKRPVSENGREVVFFSSKVQLISTNTGGSWTRLIPPAFSKMLSFLLTSEIKSQGCLPSLLQLPPAAATIYFHLVPSLEKRASLLWPVDPPCYFHNLPSPAPFIMGLVGSMGHKQWDSWFSQLEMINLSSLIPSSQLIWHLCIDPSTFHIPFNDASFYTQGSHPQSSRFLPLWLWLPSHHLLILLKQGNLCKEQAVNCVGFMGHMASVTST